MKERILQSEKIELNDFTPGLFKTLVENRISTTDIERVKQDVVPFIKNRDDLSIWSKEYFLQLVEMVRFL